MVARMSPMSPTFRMWRTVFIAALSALALIAAAEVLPDPTRPPEAALAAPADAASAPSDALQLQSVLIGHGRTPAAVINGELVLLGGKVRDARLVRLTEHSAVLKGPQGTTTLALLPALARRAPAHPAPETTP